MKKHLLIFGILFVSINLFGQSEKYVQAMSASLEKMQNVETMADWQGLANGFERIANAESDQWLPAYYVSYCNMMMAIKEMQGENDKTQDFVEAAQIALNKAIAIAPKESEVVALQAYIYQGRIWSSPMVKGAIYGPKSAAACEKAMELNPENPRAYHLLGQNTFYTPSFFGGGAENALPILEKADEKFKTFQAESDLHPAWGLHYNSYLLKKARKSMGVETGQNN